MNDDAFEELFLSLATSPAGDHADVSELDLTSAQAQEIADLLDTARLVRSVGIDIPALSQDRTAEMLGLVSDQPLDRRELKRLRLRKGLSVSQLAQSLRKRGWEVSDQQSFDWEQHDHLLMSTALMSVVAEELGTEPAVLVRGAETEQASTLRAIRNTDQFRAFVGRWASALRISIDAAESQLSSKALAAVYRGDAADGEQMLQSLAALVAAVESRNGRK